MCKALLGLVLVLGFADGVETQGYSVGQTVLGSVALPLAGANGTLCTLTGSIGTDSSPCSQLATAYTNGSNGSNPTTTGGIVNYSLGVAGAAHYQSQFYGPDSNTSMKPISAPRVGLETGNEGTVNPSGLDNIIFVDGVTYPCTSTGIQAAVTKAHGGHVVLPSGTCSFDPSVGFSVPNGTWISGAGKYATTLRIPNGNNSTIPMVNINGTAANNIYLSDFTIDGNAQNQTSGGPLIQVLSNGGKIRVERMVLQNSWADCFIALSNGSGNYSSDIEILGNEFNVCGHIGSTTGDVRIFQPLRVKVNGNKFNNSIAVASVTFSSQVGAGQVEVANNHFVGGTGYGVVLGGGTIGASDGNVHDNFFSMAPTANQNVIDISYWNNVTIHHNHILVMGTCCNGISDLPPAFRTVVDGNEIFGSPSLITNSCIALGGTATVITHNYCQGAGGAGIVLAIGATSQTRSVTVTDNIVKNNSQQTSGAKAGIETFLAPGGTASLSDVDTEEQPSLRRSSKPHARLGHRCCRRGTSNWLSQHYCREQQRSRK